MPYTKDHKQKSRQRILRSAVKLFTRQGFENTSIDQVMADAGMTRGAFYAHFKSKQELYAEAIASAGAFSVMTRSKPAEMDEREWVAHLIGNYLHRRHITDTELPCPLAFLATDVAVREPESRKAYTDAYLRMNKMLQGYTNRYSPRDSDTVMAVTAMMIGGIAIARTLDSGTSRNRLLKSCRELAVDLLGASH